MDIDKAFSYSECCDKVNYATASKLYRHEQCDEGGSGQSHTSLSGKVATPMAMPKSLPNLGTAFKLHLQYAHTTFSPVFRQPVARPDSTNGTTTSFANTTSPLSSRSRNRLQDSSAFFPAFRSNLQPRRSFGYLRPLSLRRRQKWPSTNCRLIKWI